MKTRRLFITQSAVAASVVAFPLVAVAQTQPIRVLVSASAGGFTDTLARTLSVELRRLLGRVVVVENRPGAGGNTLLMSFTSHAINASLYPSLPFDQVKDFTPQSCVATSTSILVANPAVPANDVQELIAYAKANPGKLNFAIGALGSSLHLAGEQFKMQSGVNIVNIPYVGTAPPIADVMAGQVELLFAEIGVSQAQLKAGKIKALGVTNAKRLAQFPDVPAIGEVLPGYESSAWFGLFGPPGMTPELVRRVSDAIRKSIAALDVRRPLEMEGAIAVGNSPGRWPVPEVTIPCRGRRRQVRQCVALQLQRLCRVGFSLPISSQSGCHDRLLNRCRGYRE